MKAAVFYNCGDASEIQIAEVPEPQIGAGQVLIRVHASAFNHLELWSLHGPAPAGESYRFPMWTGSDIAGVIEYRAVRSNEFPRDKVRAVLSSPNSSWIATPSVA